MRLLPLLILPLLAGCASSADAPSLAPRPAEQIDPRVPVPDPVVPSAPAPGLVSQLDTLVARASEGDRAFQPLAQNAAGLAAAAGARQSESWIAAQQALSAAIAGRAPVARALADIDALGAEKVQAVGGIGAADLKAIRSAASRVADIDNREAGAIDRVQAELAR